ncbi:MAG: pyruvate ferredoxin oxidoreductase, partial [Verrucomicrobium sp.]
GGTFETVDETQHDVTDDAAAFKLSENLAPGKFGVYYQVQRPTKNALEQKWVAETQAKLDGATQKSLLKKRFESMR